MINYKELEESIQQILNKVAKDSVDRNGAFCTNYILISEFMDSQGDYWTFVYKNEDLPIWRHTGLLQYALETGLEDYDESEEDDG